MLRYARVNRDMTVSWWPADLFVTWSTMCELGCKSWHAVVYLLRELDETLIKIVGGFIQAEESFAFFGA